MHKAEAETIDHVHGRVITKRGHAGREMARKAFDTVRGRPRKGAKAEGSRAKSLRLPDATWRDLATEAKRRGITVHKLIRIFVAERLYTISRAELRADGNTTKRGKADHAA